MQALPQKTTDYIADQFRAYFDRKAQRHGMNYKDARAFVDFLSVAGPAPEPAESAAIDYAKPRVSGSGGRKRPSQERIEQILDKYAIEEEEAMWDSVFDALIALYEDRGNKKALRLIKLAFQKQLKREEICEKMHISEKTYRNYRTAILTLAGISWIQRGGTLDI